MKWLPLLLAPLALTAQEQVLIAQVKGVALISCLDELNDINIDTVVGVAKCKLQLPGPLEKLANKMLPLFKNKPLTKVVIQELQDEIIKFYKSYSRPVVMVKVPEQNITCGVLKLLVVESHLGKIETEGHCWTKSEWLKNQVHLEPGDPIDEKRLAQDLRWINANPFRSTSAIYTPGEKPGTTDIILSTSERSAFKVYAGADNTGLSKTGHMRFFTGATAANLFGLGHILSYQYTTSTDFNEFQAHTFNYSAPLPWRHRVTLFGGFSLTRAALRKVTPFMHGHSAQGSFRYHIPLFPCNQLIQEVRAGGDFKRMNTTVEFSKEERSGASVNLTQLVFGYAMNIDKPTYNVGAQADVYWSPGEWISSQNTMNFRNLRAHSNNKYVYMRARAHIQIPFFYGFTFHARAEGQVANENLLASEQLGLGGLHSVRGYQEREFNVDSGILATVELHAPTYRIFKKTQDRLIVYAFSDYGIGALHKNTTSMPNDPPYLWSIGPAIRYEIAPYVTARLDWGWRLNQKGFGSSKSRLHFSIVGNY